MVSATFSSPGCQHPRSGHHRSSHRPREAHPSLLRATPHLHISATPWQPASACCWTQSLLPGSWSRPSDPGPSGAPPPHCRWPSSRRDRDPCPPAASPSSPSSGANMACNAVSRRIEHALSGAHASSSCPSLCRSRPRRLLSRRGRPPRHGLPRLCGQAGCCASVQSGSALTLVFCVVDMSSLCVGRRCKLVAATTSARVQRRHTTLSLPMSAPSSVLRLSFKLFPSLAPSPPVWLNLAQAPAQLYSPCHPSSSLSPLLDLLLSLPSWPDSPLLRPSRLDLSSLWSDRRLHGWIRRCRGLPGRIRRYPLLLYHGRGHPDWRRHVRCRRPPWRGSSTIE
jgi:hypothetical protein